MFTRLQKSKPVSKQDTWLVEALLVDFASLVANTIVIVLTGFKDC